MDSRLHTLSYTVGGSAGFHFENIRQYNSKKKKKKKRLTSTELKVELTVV